MQGNKHSASLDTRRARIGQYLRKWVRHHGRGVQHQAIRGAAYSVGSGTVSLLILWMQARY